VRRAYRGSIAAVVEATLSGSGELRVGWDIEVAMALVVERLVMASYTSG